MDEMIELLREILAEIQEIRTLLEDCREYTVVPFPDDGDDTKTTSWWAGNDLYVVDP
jgi:hypothetical protein